MPPTRHARTCPDSFRVSAHPYGNPPATAHSLAHRMPRSWHRRRAPCTAPWSGDSHEEAMVALETGALDHFAATVAPTADAQTSMHYNGTLELALMPWQKHTEQSIGKIVSGASSAMSGRGVPRPSTWLEVTMSIDSSTDERKTYKAVQTIIDSMLEFDQDTRERMLRTVSTFFGIDSPSAIQSHERLPSNKEVSAPAFSNREDLSPKDFLVQKKPKTDVERVACLAFYLTHYRNTAHFKTMDINKLNTEAAQLKFSNASNSLNNAVKSGFLVPSVSGAKQLSAAGEKFVDHLPDRTMARKVMSELSPRRKKRVTAKDATSSSNNQGNLGND